MESKPARARWSPSMAIRGTQAFETEPDMTSRRRFIAGAGLAGGLMGADLAAGAHAASPSGPVAERLSEAIAAMPVDDTHCHPLSDRDAHTTVDGFIERIALSAFPGPNYFPEGV